jgi:ETFB lysine methyltransferase
MQSDRAVPDPDVILKNLGPIAREQVIVEGRTFLIDHPGESDRLQNHPAVRAAFPADPYIPYWAELWPAARMLAKAILHEPWTPALPALEIGCGLGLGGIVALSVGLSVTFSDHDVCALRFAADNARLNGHEGFSTLQVDWRAPPPDLRFPVILGSDLLYDGKIVAPLIAFLDHTLAPGGLCLLTDQDRMPSQMFKQQLTDGEWTFTTTMMRAGEPKRGRAKGTLYRITRPQ